MSLHQLKVWPPYWEDIENEIKLFEIRKDDRNFLKGDFLELKEFDPSKQIYTGRVCKALITYKITGFGLEKGYCILGLKKLKKRSKMKKKKSRTKILKAKLKRKKRRKNIDKIYAPFLL